MRSNKIALIAPNKAFTLRALDLFGEWGENIHVSMASGKDVILITQQLREKGADALICYADLTKTIQTIVNIPTVSLRPSISDILRGMQQAKEWLTKNGRDAAADMVVGITGHCIIDDAITVATILGLKTKIISEFEETKLSGILAIVKEVPNLVTLQDPQVEYIAENIPCFPVTVGQETLLKAVRQAQELVTENHREWAQLEQIKATMEFTGVGIVAIDTQKQITYANQLAKKLLKIPKNEIINKVIAGVFTEINLDDALLYGQTILIPLAEGSEQGLTCRVVPMIIGGQTVGAVLTIYESFPPYKDRFCKVRSDSGHTATYHFEDFITVSKTMKEILDVASSYASVDSTILIIGDTGTGKEIIAQSIHNCSRRRHGPFVAINCAALPESLLESELFGYEYGAFTGARKNGKKGLFEQADKGTIFLDEIGEISLGMQARLLRVIQEREIMRIGGDKIIPVDVGIVAATHRDLPDLIEKGLFRRDLYYRLAVLPLRLPALSAKKEDIPALFESINKKLSAKLYKQPLTFNNESLDILLRYPWPGNVRELESVIERLLVLKNGKTVTGEDVKKVLDHGFDQQTDAVRIVPRGTMAEMEQAIILQVLNETKSQEETAKILGISATTVWRKIKMTKNK